MGKIKKGRVKLHQKAVRFGDRTQEVHENESSLPAIFPITGLFSESSKQDDQEGKVCKKDKRKERHEKFLKKLHGHQAVKESIKKAEQRAQTVIVGDMEPLLSALPTILPANVKSSNPTTKTKKLSSKSRQKMQISEIERFQQVLKHQVYQRDPISAISEHLKLSIERETTENT